MAKRIFDIIFSSVVLILFLPFLIIIAILIKLDSKGPVFFKQKRVGKDNKIFNIYKFRTLYNSSKNLHIDTRRIKNIDNFIFLSPPKDEITRIGNFLRSTSLNEFPQFINVLKGEMSVVGPRPEVPEIVNLYPEKYRKRLTIKPGITGLAQIKGKRSLNQKEIISYDLEYIKNYSMLLDLKIIMKTIKVVLSKKGAK